MKLYCKNTRIGLRVSSKNINREYIYEIVSSTINGMYVLDISAYNKYIGCKRFTIRNFNQVKTFLNNWSIIKMDSGCEEFEKSTQPWLVSKIRNDKIYNILK